MSKSLSLSLGVALAGCVTFVPTASATVVEAGVSESVSIQLAASTVDALRRKVLAQCGLDGVRNTLPWYFHFEFGRALLQAGDARRAVVQLSQSVELNPEPRADKRLYGMWFTDYLPYFQLADAHVRLGNWPCAAQAWQLSQASGETRTGRLDPARLRAVEDAIGAHGDAVGACHAHEVEALAFAGL
ncbi:MAG TPA: hypothetical protein PKO41_02010 [Dokdonella sp.]|uniref:hypothetical protein n=1 Tax=Dokdonella sp. TaxID=2291710 RepID=UPI0025C694F9|nr:hypothetical protein [Dokdonella sp.]MBX3690920.1 hypothetical protein [Dokdonella sp.]MCW5568304.1 hypothetical protein [Dokdonella sp.]HNR91177.1 hypothetical protein [Dokdonella sp.]